MADRKITDLTALAAGSQATGDLLTIVDVSEGAAADKNKKITVENLLKGIPSNVGIGTSSPSTKLHIADAAAPEFRIEDTTNGCKGFMRPTDSAVRLGVGSNNPLLFFINGSERMQIDTSGRVGIGDSSPDFDLVIKGGSNTNENLFACKDSDGTKMVSVEQDSSGNGRLLVFDTSGNNDVLLHTSGNSFFNGGNVGINNTSPDGKLAILHTLNSAYATTSRNNTFLQIRNDSTTSGCYAGIEIAAQGAGNDSIAQLTTVDTGSGNTDFVIGLRSSSTFTEKARFQNNGGISFNGDTAAANALDDYEEGTFTPTIDVSGSSGTLSVSYASQTGRYIKVGRTVFFTIDVRLSNFSRGTGTGGIIVFGLPHVPVNTSNYARSNGFANLYNWNYSSTAADIPMFIVRQTGNQSYMDIKIHRLNNTDADVNDPDNDSMVFLAGTYETVS